MSLDRKKGLVSRVRSLLSSRVFWVSSCSLDLAFQIKYEVGKEGKEMRNKAWQRVSVPGPDERQWALIRTRQGREQRWVLVAFERGRLGDHYRLIRCMFT